MASLALSLVGYAVGGPIGALVGGLAGNGTLTKLGILTAADNTNRLALKSNGALFSHDDVTPGTGDMRIVLNKSAAGWVIWRTRTALSKRQRAIWCAPA